MPGRGLWPRRRAAGLAVAIAVVGVAADQISKAAAISKLTPGARVPVLPPVLHLQLVRNPGAAFSLGENSTWLFALLAIAVAGLLCVFVLPRLRVPGWSVLVGLFLAGILGNLIDRLVRPPGVLRGHVVDFLELPNWPIFNVADMCISAAAAGLVVLTLVAKVGYDGRPVTRRGGEDGLSADPAEEA